MPPTQLRPPDPTPTDPPPSERPPPARAPSYGQFLRTNARFLGFGFLLCFCSSFGQTFFLGTFGADWRREFGLSNGEFGWVYTLATLTSALCLLVVGRLVDRVDLRRLTAAVVGGLGLAGWLMSSADGLVLLWGSLFLLRLTGQGLMGHLAMTGMTRYFTSHRARAVSLAAVGFAAGEAVWPRLSIVVREAIGWRATWQWISGLLVLGVVPLTWWLLRGHARRHRDYLDAQARRHADPNDDSMRDWTVREVLRDSRFYCLLPAVLATPMIVTGLFLHQERVIAEEGWTTMIYSNWFIGFAVAQWATGLLIAPTVDRLGARRMMWLTILPMALGLGAVAWAADGVVVCALYLLPAGLTAGAVTTTVGPLWVELYGVRHLGAIRSVQSAFMVVSTAITPVAFGELFDRGVTVEHLALGLVGYLVVASALARRVRSPSVPAEKS